MASDGEYCLFKVEFCNVKKKEDGVVIFSVNIVKKLMS